MRRTRTTLMAIACVAAAACSRSTPSPQPPTVPPGSPVTVTGREKLGWDQAAASLAELDGIGFSLYVDDNKPPVNYTKVPCAAGASAGIFFCQIPLPPDMGTGPHTLRLAAFYVATPETVSAKSDALQIVVTGIVAGADASAALPGSSTSPAAPRMDAEWPDALIRIADGLHRPADLAFTADGRLWIAERSGRIRVLRDRTLLAEPALTLDPRIEGGAVIAVAPDPHFADNHFVFAVYTDRSRSGRLTFAIARFREAADTLADRVVILDNVPASPDPRASLRFGLDGKLYAAFDDGGDSRLVDDLASFNGKILRLNPDGTTPDDAARKSPVYSAGPSSPRGLAWHRSTSRLWAADSSSVGSIGWTPAPEGVAVFHDDLFVASQAGLVRAQLVRTDGQRLGAKSEVVRNLPIRAIATAPDGTVYVATDSAIARLRQDTP